MKKISNELKVGVTALITISVFIWLYTFLKGKDFFSKTATYYTVYSAIGGLAESSPVEINGYKVGVVKSIDFVDAESGKLMVAFAVSKEFRLPKNTVAEIVPMSLLGGMKVQFVYGNGPGTYSNGDTIPGRLGETLLNKVQSEILPVKVKITNLIVTLDSVINSLNEILNSDLKRNIKETASNLNNTTKSLNEIVGSEGKELTVSLDNVNKFTKMLSDNSGKMNRTFNNLKSISDTLAAANLFSFVTNLKTSLQKTTLMVDKLNSGKGTAGQLLTNDSLYKNMTNSLESLNGLLKDVKSNPKRYVHFSIFGKKDTPSR
jgi:phospholipid/cholesterol/gamma-HCH transport system substrate-binding protein